MQDTGIVRRIDELGRVVIPKELRKTLRIKEGDPLEIYTNKDELVFKKYSPMLAIEQFASTVAEGISELTEKTCVITDNEEVIYVSGGKFKELKSKKISKEIEKAIIDRKSLVISETDGGKILSVAKDERLEAENQIIIPVISSGDCYGSVIILDKEKNANLNNGDVKIAQLGATFLAKQFEI